MAHIYQLKPNARYDSFFYWILIEFIIMAYGKWAHVSKIILEMRKFSIIFYNEIEKRKNVF